MRKVIYAIAAAGLGLLAIASDAPPADAAIIYPWCAHYNGRGYGAAKCGFTTFEQCLATIAGNGGTCAMNPWYEPQQVQQQYSQRPRRRTTQY